MERKRNGTADNVVALLQVVAVALLAFDKTSVEAHLQRWEQLLEEEWKLLENAVVRLHVQFS